jgi:hypothetical protein
MIYPFLSGAIAMGFGVIALFFLRFWKNSHDRLFLLFAAAFGLLAIERIVLFFWNAQSEWTPAIYLLRLCAFSFILFAIYDKNRRE